jgi:hypothetical protein
MLKIASTKIEISTHEAKLIEDLLMSNCDHMFLTDELCIHEDTVDKVFKYMREILNKATV